MGLAPVHPVDRSFELPMAAADATPDAPVAKRSHRPSGAGAAAATPGRANAAPLSAEAFREGARKELARRQLAKQSQQSADAGDTQATEKNLGAAPLASLSVEAIREGARQNSARRQLAKQSQTQVSDSGAEISKRPRPRGSPRSNR